MASLLPSLPSIRLTNFSVPLFAFETRAMKPSPLLNRCGLAIVTTSLLIAVGSFTAIAQDAVEPSQPRRGNRPERIFRQLDLNDDQIQQLRQIHQRNRSAARSLRNDLHQAEDSLKALLADTSTRTEIESQFARVQALRQRVAQAQFQTMLDMRDVLTPAQRREFGQLMRDRGSRPR